MFVNFISVADKSILFQSRHLEQSRYPTENSMEPHAEERLLGDSSQ